MPLLPPVDTSEDRCHVVSLSARRRRPQSSVCARVVPPTADRRSARRRIRTVTARGQRGRETFPRRDNILELHDSSSGRFQLLTRLEQLAFGRVHPQRDDGGGCGRVGGRNLSTFTRTTHSRFDFHGVSVPRWPGAETAGSARRCVSCVPKPPIRPERVFHRRPRSGSLSFEAAAAAACWPAATGAPNWRRRPPKAIALTANHARPKAAPAMTSVSQ